MKKIIVLFLLVSFFGTGNSNANPIFGKKKKDKKEIQLAGEFSLIQLFNDDLLIKETYYNGKIKLCDIYLTEEVKDSVFSYREGGGILLKRYFTESGDYLEDSLFYQNGILRKYVCCCKLPQK